MARYVDYALALLADFIEFDRAAERYLEAELTPEREPKANMLLDSHLRMSDDVKRVMKRANMTLDKQTFKRAVDEIARRKKERKRSIAMREARRLEREREMALLSA